MLIGTIAIDGNMLCLVRLLSSAVKWVLDNRFITRERQLPLDKTCIWIIVYHSTMALSPFRLSKAETYYRDSNLGRATQ